MRKTLFTLFLFSLFSTVYAESNMILVSAGKFKMGSPESESNRQKDEKQHEVMISSFYVDAYEVQQKDYESVMGENPSSNIGDNLPVENVTYFDAIKFCNKKSRLEKLTPCYIIEGKSVSWDKSANGYRLLTEAEWEYACRAGSETVFNSGDWTSVIEMNYHGDYPYLIEENYNNRRNRFVQTGINRGKTLPVDSLQPNALGLYNMHGNVREWVFDFYGNYETRNMVDPAGASKGIYRVVRGGGYADYGKNLRSACRLAANPKYSSSDLGFRIARNAVDKYGYVDTEYNEEIEGIVIPNEPKILITYFSFTGNTKIAADYIYKKLLKNFPSDAVDLMELKMISPYDDGSIYETTKEDLLNNARPRIKTKFPDMEEYDVVFIGYPVWWADMPMPVYTFLESYDLSGKTIFTFSSNSGTKFGESLSNLNKKLSESYVSSSFEFYYGGGKELENNISEWLKTSMGLKK